MVSNENEVIKPTQAQDDGKVKSVVESLNKSTKDPIFKKSAPKPDPKNRKNSSSHTNLSSAGTSTVARHKEDMRGSTTNIK